MSVEQLKAFLRTDLHYGGKADTQVISSISTLSRGRGPNPRISVLIMFGSIVERNECLRQSYHLGKGISLDKFVPKRYEEQYRIFKQQAWKLRSTMNVNTWIGFEDQKLVLKQKEKEVNGRRFAWSFYDE